MVRVEVPSRHVHQRDEVVQHRDEPRERGLHGRGHNAEIRAEVRDRGPRPQRALGQPDFPALLGKDAFAPGPSKGRRGEGQIGCVEVQREAHRVGRGQRESPF